MRSCERPSGMNSATMISSRDCGRISPRSTRSCCSTPSGSAAATSRACDADSSSRACGRIALRSSSSAGRRAGLRAARNTGRHSGAAYMLAEVDRLVGAERSADASRGPAPDRTVSELLVELSRWWTDHGRTPTKRGLNVKVARILIRPDGDFRDFQGQRLRQAIADGQFRSAKAAAYRKSL